MITRKTKLSLTLFLSLACASFSLFADTQSCVKLYPLPVNELNEILSDWFIHSGYTISRTSLTGQVHLKAIRNQENVHISLKPSSPLATEVRLTYVSNETSRKIQFKNLWNYISTYINGNEVYSTPSTIKNQTIPTTILFLIESVVCIRVKMENKDIQFSGFIINEEGLIMSTAHDLGNVKKITVIMYDGKEYKGHLVKIDHDRDLALVKINLRLDSVISIAQGRNLLGMGERLYSVGCPINLGGTVYSGTINGPPRLVNGFPFWQVNMEIHPGSSGSPVFDVQGNLVAMVMGRYRGTDSVGFLIPFGTIIDFLKEI
ncbi:MAG: serine protease [Thermodesulfobacteriota bacterium]|nr:serine protease [Thermodesulfobacteriota bacterium]